MLCKIADLLVEVPETENMVFRCQDYLTEEKGVPDIVLREDLYNISRWDKLSEDDAIYMESGGMFYANLLRRGGMMLHSSAVEYEGKAYLFSGPSGMGKSTHTQMWQQAFGDAVHVMNDDKPALRRIDGVWYAYGTPWCGKDGININTKAPVQAICFLRRGNQNSIRRLTPFEATSAIMTQTIPPSGERSLEMVLSLLDQLVSEVPVYELINLPEPDAARVSYNAMNGGVKGVTV